MSAVETFGVPTEKSVYKSNIKKTLFLDLSSSATIRIVNNTRLSIQTHYINKSTVECLGEDCPICRSNQNIIMQYPETFRDEAHYSPRRTIKMVNVLDKTPVRVCEKCGLESRTVVGAVTCKCGAIITGDAKPSMKIKVLSRGITLFDQLDAINNAVLDSNHDAIGITNYDITLAVSGVGKNKIITPIPNAISALDSFDESSLFELDKVTIRLDPSEMLELQRGVSLRDIFAARKAEKMSVDDRISLSKDNLNSIDASIDGLFGNV